MFCNSKESSVHEKKNPFNPFIMILQRACSETLKMQMWPVLQLA